MNKALFALPALAFAAACSSNEGGNATSAGAQITGAGSTFVYPVLSAWAANDLAMRALIDALDVVEGPTVSFANDPARSLLGSAIEGHDVRLAIRHPEALELVLGGRAGDVDATGIAEPGPRDWWRSAISIRGPCWSG
jgi:hypothetical protein